MAVHADNKPIKFVERYVWSFAQKATVTSLGLLMSVGTALAGFSVKLQMDNAEAIRDQQEIITGHGERLGRLEAWGPSAGPRVMMEDVSRILTNTVDKAFSLQTEQQKAFSANTAVLLEIKSTLGRMEAVQSAATRELDGLGRRIDRLEAKP